MDDFECSWFDIDVLILSSILSWPPERKSRYDSKFWPYRAFYFASHGSMQEWKGVYVAHRTARDTGATHNSETICSGRAGTSQKLEGSVDSETQKHCIR